MKPDAHKKRQLQYTLRVTLSLVSTKKNNHTLFRPHLAFTLTSHLPTSFYLYTLLHRVSLSVLRFSCFSFLVPHCFSCGTMYLFLSSHLFSLHTGLLHLLCTRLRLLVSRSSSLVSASRHERFSHALYLDMHVMSYMRCLASRLYYVYASLLYLYTSHLVLRGSMHLLHTILYITALYLYSVLLGRARSAVMSASRRAPLSCNVCSTSVACHACSAQCSTSSRTGIRE